MTDYSQWWKAHEGHGPGNARGSAGPAKLLFFAFCSSSSGKPPKGVKQMTNILDHFGYDVESGLDHEGVKMWLSMAGKR